MARTNFDDNLRHVFAQIAEEVIDGFQDVLRTKNAIGEGRPVNLIDSFEYDIESNFLRIYSTQDYAATTDTGQDAELQDPSELRTNLENWIVAKNITIKRYSKGRTGGRFVPKTAANLQSVAWVMARSILNGGYGARFGVADYSRKTMNRLKDQIDSRVGEAYTRDIERMIQENLETQYGA